MKGKRKLILAVVGLLLATGLFVAAVTPVLIPKRSDYGCLWKQYMEEPENSIDVLFFGSSVAYTDVVPAQIYASSGITAYVMAGPVQTTEETEYYLYEALKTQHPKVVFIELSGAVFLQNSTYDLINVGYLPNGINKWSCLVRTIPVRQWGYYLFPLAAYHGRWSQLGRNDLDKVLHGYEPDPLAGYTFLRDFKPYTEDEPKNEDGTPDSIARAVAALERMDDRCAREGIRMVVYLSPRCNYWKQETTEALLPALEGLRADFIDMDLASEAMGLDPSTDFFDASHQNCRGAEKFSIYLASYLTQTLGLEPTAEKDEALWQYRIDYWNALKKDD